MQTRRQTLKQSAVVAGLLAGTGLFPQYALAFNKAAFDAKSLNDALKALGASGAPAADAGVTLTAPDIAENGAVVPLAVASTLPNVKQLLLLVEKNPNALVAVFNVTPEVDASFATRAKISPARPAGTTPPAVRWCGPSSAGPPSAPRAAPPPASTRPARTGASGRPRPRCWPCPGSW